MIKIIKGTFGYFDGKKVTPITSADGPIEVDAALEKKLVDKKVAVYVTKQAEQAAQSPEGDGLPAYNKDMKLAELQEIAKAYGVDASKMKAKAEVIAAIDAAKADAEDPDGEGGSNDGDGEAPPALGAADPV